MLILARPSSSSGGSGGGMGGMVSSLSSSGGGGEGSGGGGANNAIASLLSSLDEVMVLAMRNLDDESPGVSSSWSEALARCICTSIQYGETTRAATADNAASMRNVEVDDDDDADNNTSTGN
eukprot:7945976-Ditylum_brightwellii.AAC.1